MEKCLFFINMIAISAFFPCSISSSFLVTRNRQWLSIMASFLACFCLIDWCSFYAYRVAAKANKYFNEYLDTAEHGLVPLMKINNMEGLQVLSPEYWYFIKLRVHQSLTILLRILPSLCSRGCTHLQLTCQLRASLVSLDLIETHSLWIYLAQWFEEKINHTMCIHFVSQCLSKTLLMMSI